MVGAVRFGDLVHRGGHGGSGQELVEVFGGEVADADGLGEPEALALLHRPPHAFEVERDGVLRLGREHRWRRLQADRPVD